MSTQAEDKVQYKLVMPSDLKIALETLAESHRRSLSAEIISILQTAVTNAAPGLPGELALGGVFPVAQLDRLVSRLEMVATDGLQYILEVKDEARRLGGGISQVENYRLEPALRHFMTDTQMERPTAIQHIMREWLTGKGYVKVET